MSVTAWNFVSGALPFWFHQRSIGCAWPCLWFGGEPRHRTMYETMAAATRIAAERSYNAPIYRQWRELTSEAAGPRVRLGFESASNLSLGGEAAEAVRERAATRAGRQGMHAHTCPVTPSALHAPRCRAAWQALRAISRTPCPRLQAALHKEAMLSQDPRGMQGGFRVQQQVECDRECLSQGQWLLRIGAGRPRDPLQSPERQRRMGPGSAR